MRSRLMKLEEDLKNMRATLDKINVNKIVEMIREDRESR